MKRFAVAVLKLIIARLAADAMVSATKFLKKKIDKKREEAREIEDMIRKHEQEMVDEEQT